MRIRYSAPQERPSSRVVALLRIWFSCRDYPAPKPSKLDGVVNAVLIVFALVYGLLGVWGLLQLFA